MKNKKTKIVIWPCSKPFIAIMLVPIILIVGGGGGLFINALSGYDLYFFQKITTSTRIIETLFWLVMSSLLFYVAVLKIILNNTVTFDETTISRPKKEMWLMKKLPAFQINCSDIVEGNLHVGFYAFLTLKTNKNRKYKIFVTPFSMKQIRKILMLIKERGGQMDYEKIEYILKHEYLFGKRKKKKFKKKTEEQEKK